MAHGSSQKISACPSKEVHFLKVRSLSYRAMSYLFLATMREGTIASAGLADNSGHIFYSGKRDRATGRITKRAPSVWSRQTPAGHLDSSPLWSLPGCTGPSLCTGIIYWCLILGNEIHSVVNFKTSSDTTSKIYTKMEKKKPGKEQKNKQWIKIYWNKILPWSS